MHFPQYLRLPLCLPLGLSFQLIADPHSPGCELITHGICQRIQENDFENKSLFSRLVAFVVDVRDDCELYQSYSGIWDTGQEPQLPSLGRH